MRAFCRPMRISTKTESERNQVISFALFGGLLHWLVAFVHLFAIPILIAFQECFAESEAFGFVELFVIFGIEIAAIFGVIFPFVASFAVTVFAL